MSKEYTILCNEVIEHDGLIYEVNCSWLDCKHCPFNTHEIGYCGNLTPDEAINIAFDYIYNNDSKENISTDNINNPSHYNKGKIEVIEVIEDWKLNFNLGNAIKYIGRCEHKNNKQEDIKKAIWYLERELNNE